MFLIKVSKIYNHTDLFYDGTIDLSVFVFLHQSK